MLKTIVSTLQTVMGSALSQQSAVDSVSQWRLKPSHELIFDSGRHEIGQYMQAVDKLQQSGSNDKLISIAMDRLKSEFLAVLKRQTDHQAGPISTTDWSTTVSDSTACAIRYEDYVIPEPLNDDVVTYLRNIAERMNTSGKIGECVKVYKSVRKSFVQSQLRRVRFDEISGVYNTKRYMPAELKVKMELWVQVSKICVKILFVRERDLCYQIFEGFGDHVKDECFVGTVKDFAVGLFGFVEAVSLSKQSYDKMGAVLGVYDAFMWVLPVADGLFVSEHGKEIRNRCLEALSRIGIDVGRMMHDFQNGVLHEIADVSDDRGGVHRSIKHVMEEVNVIVRNKKLLSNVIKSVPLLDFGDLVIPQEALGHYSYNRSFLELHLILIIEVLQRNIETKSNSYQDSCLKLLFMMNNIHYIVQKIEGSNELKEMIGDHYLAKLHDNLKSAMTSYQASICLKFLNCFQENGLYTTRCFKYGPSKTAIKRRLNAFNAVFDEIKMLHSVWIIPDSELREEIRVSISRIVVPAYKSFLEKLQSDPETKLLLERKIKHSADELEGLILENLFTHSEV